MCEQRVIYVCSLSDISVISCTDMENVYNCTNGRIKNPTVHCTNVCESHSRPFTDAETRHSPVVLGRETRHILLVLENR